MRIGRETEVIVVEPVESPVPLEQPAEPVEAPKEPAENG